jgi:protein-arginine deiminase
VEEVLADADFEALNKTDVQGELNAIRASMNAAAGGLSFVSLPNLFFGRRAGFAGGHHSVAFNPGPTNLQPLGGKRYVPRQFGPRTAAGTDLYESAIRTALGAGTEFVDCWDLYHRLLGEVHCGSEVKRDFPGVDWWTKIP